MKEVVILLVLQFLNFYLFYCMGWMTRYRKTLKAQSKLLRMKLDDQITTEEFVTRELDIPSNRDDAPYFVQLMDKIYDYFHPKVTRKEISSIGEKDAAN